MARFFAELLSPDWWISVVVVSTVIGVFVNLITGKVQRLLERSQSYVGTLARRRTERDQQKFEELVSSVGDTRHEEIHARFDALTWAFGGVFFLVLATAVGQIGITFGVLRRIDLVKRGLTTRPSEIDQPTTLNWTVISMYVVCGFSVLIMITALASLRNFAEITKAIRESRRRKGLGTARSTPSGQD